jgi:CBS domain containing-hemolysin-like protein
VQLLLFPMHLFPLKRWIYGMLGLEAESINPLDTSVQLRAMGEDDTSLSPVIRKIVDRSIHMKELVVHDVLLPRNEVVIYDLNQDAATNLKLMKRAGHTRFPLCNGDLDDCIGIIHIKDIFRSESGECVLNPMALKRPTTTFLLETPLEESLQRMLRAKIHLGIVYDTFGGALGVVTLERILEELVGDIQDEFDSEEDPITLLAGKGIYRILGQTPIHDLEARLGVVVENDEVSTFGGLITAELGRIPVAGERLDICNMQIEIVDVDDRRVISTQVHC